MKTILFFIFALLLLSTSCVQNLFQKTYGGQFNDAATAITKASGNHLLIAGKYEASGFGSRPYLLRTDQNGGVIWSKVFSSSPWGLATDVRETFDNNIILLCHNFLASEMIVVKTDPNGNTLWTKSYGNPSSSNLFTPQHIEETPDHGFIITGTSAVTTDYEVVVVRLDINGNWIWGYHYGFAGGNADYGRMIKIDPSGNFLVVGESKNGSTDLITLMKLNPNGQVIWSKAFEGADPQDYQETGLAIQIRNNEIILSGHGSDDIILMKLDLSGNVLWSKKYPLPNHQDDCSVGLTSDGGYVVEGFTASGTGGIFLMKTDVNGIPQWYHVYTGNSILSTTLTGHGFPVPVQLNDGGFALVGESGFGPNPRNAILIRTDKNGNSPCHMLSAMPIAENFQYNEILLTWTAQPFTPVANTPTSTASNPTQVVTTVCEQLNCTPAPTGIRAWFPFNNNLDDIAGSNNAVAGSGTTVSYFPFATVQQGLILNGTADHYLAPSGAGLNFGTGDFSVDLWLRFDNTNTGTRTILDKRILSPIITGYALFTNNGTLGIQLADGAGSQYTNYSSTSTNLNDNNWHFVTVSVERNNPTGGKFYVDGNPAGVFDPTGRQGSLNNSAPLVIGRSAAGSGYFKGILDEVELFDRALSSLEVQEIYIARSSGKCTSVAYAPECETFCASDVSKVVGITVCNFGSTSQTYTFQSLSGLPLGSNNGSCTVNGPTAYTILTPTVTVTPGNCGLLQVQINRPIDLDLPFETACYEVAITDLQGKSIWANGCLIDRSDLCRSAGGGAEQASFHSLPAGKNQKLGFHLENTTKQVKNIAYRILAVPAAGVEKNEALSLNGQPCEKHVEGTVSLSPGGRTDISCDARFLQHRAFQLYRIVLETDDNNDGRFEAVYSVNMRSLPGEKTE